MYVIKLWLFQEPHVALLGDRQLTSKVQYTSTLDSLLFLCPFSRKKKTAEGEKPHSSGAGNLRTAAAALNFKAAFQELKKKSSAINLFSNTPTAGVPPPSPATGYDGKFDATGKSVEVLASDLTGSKSHEGDFFSSGDLPRVSPSTLSLVDEVDAFGKGSEHISLGEREFYLADFTSSCYYMLKYVENCSYMQRFAGQ